MNILKIILIGLIVFVGIDHTFSGTIDPKVPDKKYIEYGKAFNYVGKLCGTYKDNNNFCASAVAIDDHHILTAAHVVKDSLTCFVTFENKQFCISNVIINKDFNTEFGVADIAIGYSEEPFGLDFYPSLYTDTDEQNQICSISGYGITGTFKTGATISDSLRRAGSNYIDHIEKDLLVCTPSKSTDPKNTSLEFCIASGDSGGGLFIRDKLAGINSCVMRINGLPNSIYGDESGHTRISKFVEWIKKHKHEKK